MRLLSLRLLNFRQHAETEIHFGTGLTGIFGPNGAGKSTLLEALAWAIYGSDAARGTNETIRFARAGPRSRVEVELRFAIGGHEYRVTRTLHNAEVFLDGAGTPVATGVGGVTRYLEGRLGMTRREFFNTYFTGQKELQFLAAMGSTDRGRFLSQVLGYERLREAQTLVRRRQNELKHEIAGLRAGMGNLDEILARRAAAVEQVRQAQEALLEAQREHAAAANALTTLTPRWTAAEKTRDRDRELVSVIQLAEQERRLARQEIARADTELLRIVQAEKELAGLREQLAELPSVEEECKRLSELQRMHERRMGLLRQLATADADLARTEERTARIDQAPELARRYAAELEAMHAEQHQTETVLEQRRTAWVKDQQDAKTKLQAFRDRGHELKEQIRGIRSAGPQGKCPTCERPLGADFERVLKELEEQWNNVVQDGKWWKQRVEQLEQKPEEVAEAEERLRELKRSVEEATKKLHHCEAGAQELSRLQPVRAEQQAHRDDLRRELEALPEEYDRAVHQAAEAQLRLLREVEKRAARLEETAARRGATEHERQAASEREAAAAVRAATTAREREALGFSEAAFEAMRQEHESAKQRHRQAELRATELQGRLSVAEKSREAAEQAETDYRDRVREVEALDDDFRHHGELDEAFSALRTELNAQVRPELSEIASAFLAQLTDGRYTSLEIDAGYNIMVLDEGEEKPVISGGEEDVANLVLRLSLSQMIAERAGHPLSLLILDEVFGSLDLARRDNVVRLLRGLEDRFEQVILITHIEGIRETLDQVLRVEFDERTGSSIVRSESLTGPDIPPGVDLAAD